jgi:Domain of unknown function (DUF4382)
MMDLATRRIVYYGLVGLLIAGSTVAVFQAVPTPFLAKDGTISIYFSGIQSDILSNQPIGQVAFISAASPSISPLGKPAANIISLNVTIDSASLHKSGDTNDSWVPIPHWTTTTIDLLKRTNVLTLVASAKVPGENITMIRLHVSSAVAAVKNSSGVVSIKTVVVPSEMLKIPLTPDARISGQMTTSIIVDRPQIVVEGTGEIRLTSVLHVDSVNESR